MMMVRLIGAMIIFDGLRRGHSSGMHLIIRQTHICLRCIQQQQQNYTHTHTRTHAHTHSSVLSFFPPLLQVRSETGDDTSLWNRLNSLTRYTRKDWGTWIFPSSTDPPKANHRTANEQHLRGVPQKLRIHGT